ncbi:MAG: hypothetical protein P8J33_15935 [Pirellulaceae bacterium]|nr:hypothetical protein [Pirellulaceae bacterium]
MTATNWNSTKAALEKYFHDRLIYKIDTDESDDWYQNLFALTHEQGNRQGRR